MKNRRSFLSSASRRWQGLSWACLARRASLLSAAIDGDSKRRCRGVFVAAAVLVAELLFFDDLGLGQEVILQPPPLVAIDVVDQLD